ncbi:LppU/SCO3897 family protein [Saccharothrix hoggarensis]|uniref:Subtilisin inhibitor-like n=1 Tax=Saccharothrix hoggarensis TaxID=913853 RepID=A0ABW3QMW2_9PSEU
MRKNGWVIGAVAVAVAAAFAVTVFGGDHGGSAPEPGTCARIEGVADKPRYLAVECGSDDATLKVAKVVDDAKECPTGGAPYSTYTGSTTLCLIPNFVEGACYQHDKGTGLRKVDCATTDAVRVVKAVSALVNCGRSRAVQYPEPVVTFCLGRAGPG